MPAPQEPQQQAPMEMMSPDAPGVVSQQPAVEPQPDLSLRGGEEAGYTHTGAVVTTSITFNFNASIRNVLIAFFKSRAQLIIFTYHIAAMANFTALKLGPWFEKIQGHNESAKGKSKAKDQSTNKKKGKRKWKLGSKSKGTDEGEDGGNGKGKDGDRGKGRSRSRRKSKSKDSSSPNWTSVVDKLPTIPEHSGESSLGRKNPPTRKK
ncbi:hypothetical protein EKO27_g4934 [Xylaria grammica]|uniref:Uncharacterized protein n=1 Tax=Xylaria grammica TaxID=363999 RepID=A0A439D6Z7_9PEZI|nr:hypothetical protein EKO27_g4934 [Xylaria grammica]